MEEHPIQGLMTTAMESLKEMIDANTIIGDPVESPDGSVIIPVSKLGFGFAAGGSEFNGSDSSEDSKLPFGGGSGGGVSITPIAFLVIGKQGIKMVHLDQRVHLYERLLNHSPQVFQKIQEMLKEAGIHVPMKKKEEEEGNSRKSDERETRKKSNEDNINYDI